MGAEVLMSSHTFKFMKTDEVLRIVTAQQERGADVAKIVTAANSEEEELENLRTAEKLKYELDIPLPLPGGRISQQAAETARSVPRRGHVADRAVV